MTSDKTIMGIRVVPCDAVPDDSFFIVTRTEWEKILSDLGVLTAGKDILQAETTATELGLFYRLYKEATDAS